jgi:hypothetical protein
MDISPNLDQCQKNLKEKTEMNSARVDVATDQDIKISLPNLEK